MPKRGKLWKYHDHQTYILTSEDLKRGETCTEAVRFRPLREAEFIVQSSVSLSVGDSKIKRRTMVVFEL